MTTTTLRASVRRRINQTDNTNTQFADAMIDELGNQARVMFAGVLPERMLTGLITGYTGTLTVTLGSATYPTNFLRRLKDKEVLVDSLHARNLAGEEWRLKFLESNDNTKSDTVDAYYQENAEGLKVWPTTASALTYPYIKKPTDLSVSTNTEMPPDVDNMVVDYVFEKLMGTRRGDKELAVWLSQQRGFLERKIEAR